MRRIISLGVIALLTLGCTENGSDPASPTAPSFAKGGGASPTISSADPTWTTQDTTIDVRVIGSGFDNGSRADWAIDGVTNPSNVRTNSTRYVSASELVANITVSGTAPTVQYDIVVTTRLGKKGIGAEKFTVVPKGGPGPIQYPAEMTFEDAGADLKSDGKGPYRNNVCGVGAVANLYSTGKWGFRMGTTGNRIPKSQTAACAGIAPRAASLRLAVKHLSDSPHVDDPAPVDGGTFPMGSLALVNSGESLFNGTPCTGVSFRLDSRNYPGSNDLIRENLGNGFWHLYTAPYPNNIGYCQSSSGISYWHVVMSIRVQILGS